MILVSQQITENTILFTYCSGIMVRTKSPHHNTVNFVLLYLHLTITNILKITCINQEYIVMINPYKSVRMMFKVIFSSYTNLL